jgi:hypothetical protein
LSGAEAKVAIFLLRRRVDPAPLVAAEGTLLVVSGDNVLPERASQGLEPKPKVAHDREVADDGVLPLQAIADREKHQCEREGQQRSRRAHWGDPSVEAGAAPNETANRVLSLTQI